MTLSRKDGAVVAYPADSLHRKELSEVARELGYEDTIEMAPHVAGMLVERLYGYVINTFAELLEWLANELRRLCREKPDTVDHDVCKKLGAW